MNKDIWNKIGENYKKNWEGEPEKKLSEMELVFISSQLEKSNPRKILDIGCGTGRILHCLSKNTDNDVEIYGIDYAQSMVDLCIKNIIQAGIKSKVKEILRCDISMESLPFDSTFDFVSAIRVLKYNKNWREIIPKIKTSMNPDGIFVFTMPNKISGSFFGNYGIQNCLTTKKEVEKLLLNNSFIIEDVRSFSRLPRVFYTIFPSSIIFARLIIFFEKFLGLILGRTLFGKILFFSARKPA